uniref:CID domain-containing protein n=1 Tax=Caenorhabditis tropicalis TaxID=1561998 RepID=A0A1I7U2A4_9PELO
MHQNSSWRSDNGAPHSQTWRNSDIPLPPQERQSIPSLMDPPEVGELRKKIDECRQKIVDSEQNLNAHRNGMDDLLAAHLKTTIRTSETLKIEKMLTQNNLNIEELSSYLEAMTTSKCSKDLISQAKKWIFENCVSDQLRETILLFLLNKVKDEASGEYLRLHILYLINDWAFHCQRKKEENQMKMLARYVPKMYAYCIELSSSSELSNKLEGKLLGEWEGRGYFADSVFKQLRNTVQIVATDREIENSSYGAARESIRANLMATFDAYEQQHVTYSQHIQKQIDEMERRIMELRHGPQNGPLPQKAIASSRRSRFDQAPTADRFTGPEDRWHRNDAVPIDGEDIDGMPFEEENLKPQKSYLALPAGIMTPLVSINSFKYEPLDPEKLEMPPAVPPSSRLIAAKNQFRKGIEMDIALADGAVNEDAAFLKYPMEFLDEKARKRNAFLDDEECSIEDLIKNKPSSADQPLFDKMKKIKEEDQIAKIRASVDAYYATQEPPENLREESPRRRSESRSPVREFKRSRTRSPSPRRRRRSSSNSSNSSSSGSSASSRRSSPERGRFQRGYSDRSSFRSANEPLSADNKGAQLMAKMGWTSGRGLGSNESGIIDPVSGGEVRDRNEQFMGLGRTLDPYEQFRKQRSGTYHDRGSFHRK